MGMYTELHFACRLTDDAPIELLRYMSGEPVEKPAELPDHPLFRCERWDIVLCCDSYYFPADTRSLVYDGNGVRGFWTLNVQSNLKNYDNEIAHLIDWLTPYMADLADGEFYGYYRYEEADEPTLLHYRAR